MYDPYVPYSSTVRTILQATGYHICCETASSGAIARRIIIQDLTNKQGSRTVQVYCYVLSRLVSPPN